MLCRQQASNIADVPGILRIENQIPMLICANNDTITHWSLRHCRQTKIINNVVQEKIQLFQYYKGVYFIVHKQILTIFTDMDSVSIQLRFRAVKLFLHQINESVKVIQTAQNNANDDNQDSSYYYSQSESNQEEQSEYSETYSESDVEVYINDYTTEKIVLLVAGNNGKLIQYDVEIIEGEIYVTEGSLPDILSSQLVQDEITTIWTEYDSKYLLTCGQNSIFLLDKATWSIVTVLSFAFEDNQFAIKQLKQKITTINDEALTQFINQNMNFDFAIQHVEYSEGSIFLTLIHENEAYLIACNLKKGQILTQIALNNYVDQEIKQILVTGSDVYMFYDKQYVIIDLHSRTVTNKIVYDQITQKSSFQSAILMNKSPYSVMCIIHSHRFAIYEKNIAIQNRKTIISPLYISFINDLISKHFRDDSEAIILSNDCVNLLKFNNQTIYRQINVQNAKNLRSSGRYIFMIQKSENGHEHVQMYDLLKHKVTNVAYVPIQGQQALANLCKDLRHRCSNEEFEYYLLNNVQYIRNKDNYQNNRQQDHILDYSIDASTQNIAILSQHGVTIYSVEAAYFNSQFDTEDVEFSAIAYVSSTRDMLVWKEDQFTTIFNTQSKEEQIEGQFKHQYIALINKKLQINLLRVNYNSISLVSDIQLDKELLHVNESTQDLQVQHVGFFNRENIFYLIAFDSLNSESQFLYFLSINFNGMKLVLRLLRHTQLNGIFVHNNKLIKRNNFIYFSHEYNVYVLDLRTNVLRRSQKLVQEIQDIDISQSGEECVVCFKNSDTTRLYSMHLNGFEVVNGNGSILNAQNNFQKEETIGDQLIRYILSGNNKTNYRKDASRLKRGNALAQQLGFNQAQQKFITEQDVLFIGDQDALLQLLQKVQEIHDDKYTLGVLYMVNKYHFEMVFNTPQIKEQMIAMYNEIQDTLMHQRNADEILNAFIAFSSQ